MVNTYDQVSKESPPPNGMGVGVGGGYHSSDKEPIKPSAIELGTYGSESSDAGFLDGNGAAPLTGGLSDWNMNVLIVGIVCALSSFNYGLNIANFSSILADFSNCNTTSSSTFDSCIPVTSDAQKSATAACFCIGGLIGALSTGALTNKFGRKRILLSHNFFYILGCLLISLATHLSMLSIGRFVVGLASGACTIIVPMYLSEIATDKTRGTLGIFHQAGVVIGIVVAQALALFMVPNHWRIYIGLVILFSLLQVVILWFMGSETPKYLAAMGRMYEAEHILKKLRNSDHVHEELNVLMKARSDNDRQSLSVRKLVLYKAARMSLLVGCVYHAAQQLSGINVAFYYGDSIFEGLEISHGIVVLLIGAVNLLMTGVSIWLIDRSGRRPLMLSSASGVAVACALLTLFANINFDIGVVISALLFVACFAVGLGPVPFVILADIFPTESLDAGSFICIGVNWVCNTLVALLTPTLATSLTINFLYIPFGIICACAFVFSFMMVPETKGQAAAYL